MHESSGRTRKNMETFVENIKLPFPHPTYIFTNSQQYRFAHLKSVVIGEIVVISEGPESCSVKVHSDIYRLLFNMKTREPKIPFISIAVYLSLYRCKIVQVDNGLLFRTSIYLHPARFRTLLYINVNGFSVLKDCT